MKLEFRKVSEFKRGTLYHLLQDAYSFDQRCGECWDEDWKKFDDFFYDHLKIADQYGFITVLDGEVIGLASWDPRNRPEYVEIGHNCIATKYKGNGYGKRQLQEAIDRIKTYEGLKKIMVGTNSNLVAPHNYESVGFQLFDRHENYSVTAFSGDYLKYEIILENDIVHKKNHNQQSRQNQQYEKNQLKQQAEKNQHKQQAEKNRQKELSEMSLEELWQLFPIQLTKHKEEWEEWYFEECNELQRILIHLENIKINHIGSTAIQGIWAKPIIDILIELDNKADMDGVHNILTHYGYLCMAKSETRLDLNKGYTKYGFAKRVFHIHIRMSGDHDELYFRDFMNENPELAKEYENLKLSLWKKYEHNRDGYTDAKTEFVKKYTNQAKCIYGKLREYT